MTPFYLTRLSTGVISILMNTQYVTVVMGDSVEVARDCRRFEGLGEEVEELPSEVP